MLDEYLQFGDPFDVSVPAFQLSDPTAPLAAYRAVRLICTAYFHKESLSKISASWIADDAVPDRQPWTVQTFRKSFLLPQWTLQAATH